MRYRIEKICLPQGSPAQAEYAAGELRYYLALMCGRPRPIEADVTENCVILTQTNDPALGEDGFCITPETNAVRIRGGKRGIIYGAYALLEQLGCRFFTPECEKIPTVPEIELPLEQEIRQVPVFEYRAHNYTDLCRSPRFAVKSRVNGLF